MTNYSPELLREVADVLQDTAGKSSEYFDKSTYFQAAAFDLRYLADKLEEDSKTEFEIQVKETDDGPAVYIRKHDGEFIGVYPSSSVDQGFIVNAALAGDKRWGETIWKAKL